MLKLGSKFVVVVFAVRKLMRMTWLSICFFTNTQTLAPRIAVEQKMAAEGLDSKIVEAVMAGGGPQPTAADVSVPIPTRKAVKISSLSFQEEQRAAPYRKMVKLGMPEGAVRHKMTADSLPTRIQESVLAGEVPASEANSNNTGSGAPTTPNRKAPSNISSARNRSQRDSVSYSVPHMVPT